MRRLVLAIAAVAAVELAASAAEWPMYRGDAARSGYTSEALPGELVPRWTFRSRQAPRPAWPTRNRLRYDAAFQPIVANGAVFFGSSANDKVYALDASSGRVRWHFYTDGPVRFAPAAWKDRLLVASDDGYLYCLAAADGRLQWKRRGGPRDEMLLGNDRMISRWPARGGPVVADDMVYFGAGIWPSEGVFVYAIEPATGKTVWCNDSSGTLEMDQPHPTARAKSGIAAQGYLALAGDRLYVPTGRAVPAALDRRTGKLLCFQLQANTHAGGSDVVALDDWFFNGGTVYDAATGLSVGKAGRTGALHPLYVLFSGKQKLLAFDRQRFVVERKSAGRKKENKANKGLASPRASVDLPAEAMLQQPHYPGAEAPEDNLMGSTNWSDLEIQGQPAALIVAGDEAVVGGQDRVLRVDLRSQRIEWSAPVEGAADGLAVAGGRLYVSTDRGVMICFAAPAASREPAVIVEPRRKAAEEVAAGLSDPYEQAAAEIVRRTGVMKGYCLDLGCGEGRLVEALARRTDLEIYAVEEDETRVVAARKQLDLAGLYGTRVTVHRFDPARTPYADYFADLVVSGRSVVEGAAAASAGPYKRMLRPFGGMACFGRPGAMVESRRGPLAEAGSWTHQNADTANTLCSEDSLRGPLEMLWFRDTDFVMPLRHGRGPAPLVDRGRMFAEGLHGLRAVDIYNGRPLWEYSIPKVLSSYHREHSIGAAWTTGNYCLGADRVFVHHGSRCLVLDAGSGRKLAELAAPPRADGKPGTWGYIAYSDGRLFGSLADEAFLAGCWSPKWDTGGQFIQSTLLFAMDGRSGKVLWTLRPQHSIRNNAIAIEGQRVYLIDRARPEADDRRLWPTAMDARAKRRGEAKSKKEPPAPHQPPGRLVALDAGTGRPVWETEEDVFGTLLAVSREHGLVLLAYQPGHQASLNSELGNRMAALRAVDGKRVWDVQADYFARPILNGRTIYAEPGAWDLLSGARLPFSLKRSYGCGIPAGSRNLLVFRSATVGYVDLVAGQTTENYGGIRPGCWVNLIPAGGLVLMADAASWCTCSYLNQASMALKPARPRE